MPARFTPRYVYFDSCVFLALLNREPGRVDDIEALWDEVSKTSDFIVTAATSISEVAYSAAEKLGHNPDPQTLAKIEGMWNDPAIQIVDLTPAIARISRDLIRAGLATGLSLKPLDATQLATAAWLNQHVGLVSAFHTYDTQLFGYRNEINIPISQPTPKAPRLPFSSTGGTN